MGRTWGGGGAEMPSSLESREGTNRLWQNVWALGVGEGQGRGRMKDSETVIPHLSVCPIQGFLPHQLPPGFLQQRCHLLYPLLEVWWQCGHPGGYSCIGIPQNSSLRDWMAMSWKDGKAPKTGRYWTKLWQAQKSSCWCLASSRCVQRGKVLLVT